MVEVGPTILVAVIVLLDSMDVGVGCEDVSRVVEACGAIDGVAEVCALLLLCDDLEASAPPMPPPTAANTTIIAIIATIQNVLLRGAHIDAGAGCSYA